MSKNLLLTTVVLCFFALFITSTILADIDALKAKIIADVDASAAEDNVKSFIKEKLLPVCSSEVLVNAVLAQNAKNMSLSDIQSIDTQWQEAEEELDVMIEVLENECATQIGNITKSMPMIKEAFVMDNKGALVGANNLTSDYWQGDEAKWKNSFNDSKGGCDVGEAKFDRSANTILQQVSLPIFDADGNVVGAITFGIAPSEI